MEKKDQIVPWLIGGVQVGFYNRATGIKTRFDGTTEDANAGTVYKVVEPK